MYSQKSKFPTDATADRKYTMRVPKKMTVGVTFVNVNLDYFRPTEMYASKYEICNIFLHASAS